MLFKKVKEEFDKALFCGIMRLLLRKKTVKIRPKKEFKKNSKKKLTTTFSSGILITVTEKEVKKYTKS